MTRLDIALLLGPKQGPATAVTIMSNLICYCSKLLLLVSGTLTSYPPYCLGSLAGII